MNSTNLVLPPLSVLYSAIVRTRLAAYSRGFLSATTLDVPVISIGNLTVGGTGKTPLVEKVCRLLFAENRKVCVLTRGYKRSQPNKRVLVSDSKSVLSSEEDAGDEAFLLAQNLLGISSVISDADRVAAGKWAISNLGIDCFVLDDGFQHLQLARDLNVLVVDATDPWGGNELLPAGKLREPLSGAARADCVVITRTDEYENIRSLENRIKELVRDKPVFRSRMKLKDLRLLNSSSKIPAATNKPAAFCGVGNPGSFFRLLNRNGYSPIMKRAFADHHRYTQNEIERLILTARDAGALSLITTGKDAVKLQSLELTMPCYVADIEIELEEQEEFSKLLRRRLELKKSTPVS
jgi:tetraacyldisaccharide 4'-kinase